jgi:hypothetical protein
LLRSKEDGVTITRTMTFALVAGVFLAVTAVGAQPPAEDQPSAAREPATSASESAPQPDHQHDAGGEADVAQQQMLEDIEAELDLLVGKMNASSGEAKLDAIAELLVVLVRQREAMCPMMHGKGSHEASR